MFTWPSQPDEMGDGLGGIGFVEDFGECGDGG